MAKHKLNAQSLAAKPRGKYCDGANLWCYKDSEKIGRWVFRYQLHGEKHSVGIGSMQVFSLKEARAEADRLLKMQKRGVDPLAEKQAGVAQKKIEKAKTLTFEQCALAYIQGHSAEWRSGPHLKQWQGSLKRWVYPVIGDLPVQSIDKALVLKTLEQKVDGKSFWEARSVTASRVRSRIEIVLAWAASRDYRSAENPAGWKHLKHALPFLTTKQKVTHLKALAYDELPGFVASLRTQTDVASKALEYAILVAARPGEVQGLTWGDVDLDARLIVIPGHHMKGHREHRIPLVGRALEILQELYDGGKPASAPVFSGLGNYDLRTVIKRLGYRGVTPHGMRSAFKDWCTEQTSYPNEMSELALAHRIGSTTELAYRRGDLLQRRYRLMEDWATFAGSSAQAKHHAAA